jgi:hypothetical protein
MEYLEIWVLVISFVLLLMLGVPIAYSIGISGTLTLLITYYALPAFTTFSQRMATDLTVLPCWPFPFLSLPDS